MFSQHRCAAKPKRTGSLRFPASRRSAPAASLRLSFFARSCKFAKLNIFAFFLGQNYFYSKHNSLEKRFLGHYWPLMKMKHSLQLALNINSDLYTHPPTFVGNRDISMQKCAASCASLFYSQNFCCAQLRVMILTASCLVTCV